MTCAVHIVSAITINVNELPLMINYQFKQMYTFKPHEKDRQKDKIIRRNDYILQLYY